MKEIKNAEALLNTENISDVEPIIKRADELRIESIRTKCDLEIIQLKINTRIRDIEHSLKMLEQMTINLRKLEPASGEE